MPSHCRQTITCQLHKQKEVGRTFYKVILCLCKDYYTIPVIVWLFQCTIFYGKMQGVRERKTSSRRGRPAWRPAERSGTNLFGIIITITPHFLVYESYTARSRVATWGDPYAGKNPFFITIRIKECRSCSDV